MAEEQLERHPQDGWIVKPFPTPQAFEQWMDRHHDTEPGIWVKHAKKGSGVPSITYEEALDVALCFGWVDSRMHSVDETYFVQRWQPRRPKSNWSALNKKHAERLIAEGRMRPSGLAEIERAKADGRWDKA